MLGLFRSAPSTCALAFGVPRFLASCAFQRGVRTCHSTAAAASIDRRARSFESRPGRSRCLWAAATEAVPQAAHAKAKGEVGDVEEFENELDAMAVEDGDEDVPTEEKRPNSPRRLR